MNAPSYRSLVFADFRCYPPDVSDSADTSASESKLASDESKLEEAAAGDSTETAASASGAPSQAASLNVGKSSLKQLVTSCENGAVQLNGAVEAVTAAKARMAARKAASISTIRESAEEFKRKLDAHVDDVIKSVDKSYNATVKALDSQLDELLVSSAQLACAAHLCRAAALPASKIKSADAMESATNALKLAQSYTGPAGSTIVEAVANLAPLLSQLKSAFYPRDAFPWPENEHPVIGDDSDVAPIVLEANARSAVEVGLRLVEKDGKTPAIASVHPLDVFVTSSSTDWRVRMADDGYGAPMASDAEREVIVGTPQIRSDRIVIPLRATGTVNHASPFTTIPILFDVCGNMFHWKVGVGELRGHSGFVGAGHYITSIPMADPTESYGLAVAPSDAILVVSEYGNGRLGVYNLPSGELRHYIGGLGDAAGEQGRFSEPCKLCFTPNGNLLVADKGNNRVQEVTLDGAFVREYTVPNPRCVAVSPDGKHIAVGLTSGKYRVQILDGDWSLEVHAAKVGEGPTEFYGMCEGLRFTADGSQLIAVSSYGGKVYVYGVGGQFVRTYGAGHVGLGHQVDVELTAHGEIVVANTQQKCINIISFAEDGVVRSWDGRDADGSTKPSLHLTGLATAGKRLYVMNNNTGCIDVYE